MRLTVTHKELHYKTPASFVAARALLGRARLCVLRAEQLSPGRLRKRTRAPGRARDRFLGREMAGPSLARCERGRLVVVDEATHWVQHEEPERVNRLLLEFFRER
jgi:pimeloyl-ACP methyl ester carboxylesterase